VGGASDPTAFTVQGTATVGATKTVSGTFLPGSAVSYTVVLSNTGGATQADNPGDEFSDVLPAALTLVSASATSGTAVATVGTNTVTWNGPIPAAGSVTITINATLDAAVAAGTVVSNQGTVNFDADGNGSNEASAVSDDPGVGGASDPTTFTVQGTAAISATKTVSGTFVMGSVVTYTIVLSNTGGGVQADNPGDEFTDPVPLALSGVTVTANSGTATASGNAVAWNGAIPAGGTVTITINGNLTAATPGEPVSNQGMVNFDGNGDGTNDSTAVTDNPAAPGGTDPTAFIVAGALAQIPGVSSWGLATLALLLFLVAARRAPTRRAPR
jgi:uncharacterized repeat protein (TIGR01451 family)